MWRAAIDGRTLHFRLVGINNQNFVMQDEETGSWWQQVTGRAILGPLAGRSLERVPHDEVSFAIWRTDRPGTVVLRPDPTVDASRKYAKADWERRMESTPTVTPLPPGSPLAARTLVVGVSVGEDARAYPLDRVRQSGIVLDEIGGVPILVAVADDGRSVRAFDRRLDGQALEFVARTGAGPFAMVDLESGSEWDFGGRATAGPRRGQQLARVPFLLDYWFDWQTYHPRTDVYRTWQPRQGATPGGGAE